MNAGARGSGGSISRENELDAVAHKYYNQRMKQSSVSLIGLRSMAAVGMVCTLGLSSCGDSAPTWWKNLWGCGEKAEAPAASPKADTASAELLDYMIFSVGKMASRQASNPLWQEEVRNMRNKLEAYYSGLEKTPATLSRRVKLGVLLADMTRDLTAYDKALEQYTAVLADWESQPEADRNSLEGRRLRSAIANGTGSCLLARRRVKEALPQYEKALEIDMAIYNELAPANGEPLPKGADLSADLGRAAEDVLSSIRCMGECQFLADDPEEARDTYKRGQDLVGRMKHLAPAMSIQYIRLLSALGDLESSCGQPRQAAAAWAAAANLAQRLLQVAPSPSVKAQTVRYLRQLEGSIKTVAKQLQDSQPAAAPAPEPETEPETEDATPEPGLE